MRKNLLKQILKWALIIIGAAILLYPSISTFLMTKNSSRVISEYDTAVSQAEQEQLDAMLQEAALYNQLLAHQAGLEDEPDTSITLDDYQDLLNVTQNGMMGYISIPKLDTTSDICHGTDGTVLQSKIGHLEGTSLPVGGPSTHAVLVGHRGLPTADLFTNINKLEVGDIFCINIANHTLYYEVDQIQVVLPSEFDALQIEKGKDYVTLVTCTPYGINSHRLLVRGLRTDSPDIIETVEEQARALNFWEKLPVQYRHLLLGLSVIIFVLLIIWIIRTNRKKKEKR